MDNLPNIGDVIWIACRRENMRLECVLLTVTKHFMAGCEYVGIATDTGYETLVEWRDCDSERDAALDRFRLRMEREEAEILSDAQSRAEEFRQWAALANAQLTGVSG